MKDNELLFDRKSHVLYSKPCKKEILAKIALHYPEAERETIWEQVQRQYADFLSDWRTDLGGKRNFHNGVGGTYDCIAIMSYYTVCKAVTSFREIEEMEENLILPLFRRLRFVDCNKPFWRKLMYKAFVRAKGGETNGNLSWNHDPFLGYGTGRGLRVLYEKIPWRSGAALSCGLCRRCDGGSVHLELADPRH